MADVQLGLFHHPPLMMMMDGIEARARDLGVDLSSIDLDSITLPAGEDFGILSDDEEELQEEDPPEHEMGFGNTIVVDNVPIVLPEKFEKLEKVLRKILSPAGVIKEDGFYMPINADTNKTYGYCFVEFNTPQEAELAREIGNGYKLDKSHVLVANIFDDFERYMKVPDEWVPPEINPYTPGDNMQKWLTDEKGRDQIIIRAGPSTGVYWNDAAQLKPELACKNDYGQIVSFSCPLLEHTWLRCIGRGLRCGVGKVHLSV